MTYSLIAEGVDLVWRLNDAYRRETDTARRERIHHAHTRAQWRLARRDWKYQIAAA